jgi:ribonuclease HI
MQTFIYSDAALNNEKKENDGIAIEIKNNETNENLFYRFHNIKFRNTRENNNNNHEMLGVLFSIALASYHKLERVFIFSDNLMSVDKINYIKSKHPELFFNFKNIQFGWLQNDMKEMQNVDLLSRNVNYKKESLFKISKNIKYQELNIDDIINFDEKNYLKYLNNNFLLLKILLGLKPSQEDLNNLLLGVNIDNNLNYQIQNKTIRNYLPSYKNKYIDFKELQEKEQKNIEIKIIQNYNLLISSVLKLKLDKESNIKKDDIELNSNNNQKNKENLNKTKEKIKENEIILTVNNEIIYKISKFNKSIKGRDILNDMETIKELLSKTSLTLKDKNLFIKILTHSTNDKIFFKSTILKIENNINKNILLLLLKIIDKNKYLYIFDNSNILKKKDYRRSIKSIIFLYNNNKF